MKISNYFVLQCFEGGTIKRTASFISFTNDRDSYDKQLLKKLVYGMGSGTESGIGAHEIWHEVFFLFSLSET